MRLRRTFGCSCQRVSGQLVVCAATARFLARMVSGGRIRKPATSCHPSRLYPCNETCEMSLSARPEIYQLHEAVKMARARLWETAQSATMSTYLVLSSCLVCLFQPCSPWREVRGLDHICLPFSPSHSCFWPFISRVDHVLALSP